MEFLYFIPFIILLIIAISMTVQGWLVVHEKFGYREDPKVKGHPEMKGVRKGDGLLYVKFSDSDDDLQKKLQHRIENILEETSKYEEDE